MSAVDTVALVPNTSATDAELVDAVRAGDDEAFEELFRRYAHRIRSFVVRRVTDHGRAEDVTQDVFLAALRRLRATDSDIAFKPWLFEIARNATIDLHRRRSRAEELPVEEFELVGAEPPEAEVLARERLSHLQGAFGELSEVHHRALVMREFEGRSYREIGQRLSLTQNAVEGVLFRARRRLAKEYQAIRSRAAALLPVPWLLRGRSAAPGVEASGAGQGVTEQAAALVTAVVLAATGGAIVDQPNTAREPGPAPTVAPSAGGAEPARPDARRPAPARSPAGGARRPRRDATGRERSRGPATSAPRSSPERRDAAPTPDRDVQQQPGGSDLPRVDEGLANPGGRPSLPDAVRTESPVALAIPELPQTVPTPDVKPLLDSAKPLLDALKGKTQAG